MTTAHVRSALASALKPLGFVKRGSDLVLRQSELEHVVSVYAARRLNGYVEVAHSIFEAADPFVPANERVPLIKECIQGFKEPFIGLWAVEDFDPSLALKQSAAVAAAFSSLDDVAHFYSDRPNAEGRSYAPTQPEAKAVRIRSLSMAQMEKSLKELAISIFSKDFAPAMRLGGEIWARKLEEGGFRHCVYLAANVSATLASLQYFSFACIDIEKGRKSNDILKLLFAAPKRVLFEDGQPILIPLTDGKQMCMNASTALLRQLDLRPPNELPRLET